MRDVDEGLIKKGNEFLNEEMIDNGEAYEDEEGEEEGEGGDLENERGRGDGVLERANRTSSDARNFFGVLNRASNIVHTQTQEGGEKFQSMRQLHASATGRGLRGVSPKKFSPKKQGGKSVKDALFSLEGANRLIEDMKRVVDSRDQEEAKEGAVYDYWLIWKKWHWKQQNLKAMMEQKRRKLLRDIFYSWAGIAYRSIHAQRLAARALKKKVGIGTRSEAKAGAKRQ